MRQTLPEKKNVPATCGVCLNLPHLESPCSDIHPLQTSYPKGYPLAMSGPEKCEDEVLSTYDPELREAK